MAGSIGFVAMMSCWTALAFAALQLHSTRSKPGLAVLTFTSTVGVLVLLTHGDGLGVSWLREPALQSDALSLGSIVPLLGCGFGVLADRSARTTAWGSSAVGVASLACSIAGLSALAVGRGGGRLEFVAIIAGGAVLAIVGALGAVRRSASPNTRVVHGTAAACGAFVVIGGTLLLAAWNALS